MKNDKKLSDKEALELWRQFCQGEVWAWSALLENYYRTLFNYGWRLRPDRGFLHDCIHELFLNLWDGRSNLNSAPNSVLFYLLGAFRNLLQKELGKQSRERAQPLLPETSVTLSIEDRLVDQERSFLADARLKQLLAALPPREQEVLFLKYYENLSNQQIAELMSIQKQSVANLLHKGLLHIRKYWETRFGTSSFLWVELLLLWWE